MAKRKQKNATPVDLAAGVLFRSDRTCCVCRTAGKPVQIHHIDEDLSNSIERNLAVLCFDCHTDTQVRGGFHRKLDADQVILYRDDWIQVVARRRAVVDARAVSAPEGNSAELTLLTTTLDVLKEHEQYWQLAVICLCGITLRYDAQYRVNLLAAPQSPTSTHAFHIPSNKLSPPTGPPPPRTCYPSDRGAQMATAAQAQPTPTTTDPVDRWLQRRAATNRANSQHSTGPRTEPGKQRSSLNALRHGLTARTAVLPTEDPEAYQRHTQQFLDEYAPATPTETQLVHEIADTAWRLNRIPLLEAELFSQAPSPQSLIPQLATLGLHGSRLSRQLQKALDQLRTIQDERRHLERRQLTEAAELFLRHQHKGLPWDPTDHGFVFSKQQIERHAQHLMHRNPAYYAVKTDRKQ
jgi:hypothetical protein